MWPFSKKVEPTIAVEQPGMPFDYTGTQIFDLLALALSKKGYELIRGTSSLKQDRFGDGQWHFQGRVIPREADAGPEIKLFIDDVEMPKEAWNDLTSDRRKNYCKNHVVTLRC